MGKTTTKKKHTTLLLPISLEDGSVIYGWDNIEACSQSVYSSYHRDLLKGNLVFALQTSPTLGSDLERLVIVKNIPKEETDTRGKLTYGVGIITHGWSSYSPFVMWNYLENSIPLDLHKWSIPEEIIENYKQTIQKFKVDL